MKKLIAFYRTKGLKKYLPGIAWFFLIVILLLLPSDRLPDESSWMQKIHFDKIVHLGLFGGLVFLWLFPVFISSKTVTTRRILTAILIVAVILFGLISEYLQAYLTPDRQFDLVDWAADSAGALLSIGVTSWIAHIINLKYPRKDFSYR